MDLGGDFDLAGEDGILKTYWEAVRARYKARLLNPTALSTNTIDLPSNWTVIHINITGDKSTLFVSRQQGGGNGVEPLIFCVPLRGRRDNGSGGDEEGHLTFDDALEEFKDIVRLSDASTRAAVNVKNDNPAGRASWWKERGALDTRLRELLENVEFCWLGGFKVRYFLGFVDNVAHDDDTTIRRF